MNKFDKILIGLTIVLSIFAFTFYVKNTSQVQGSVAIANDYIATSTRQAVTGQVMQSYIVLDSTNGALGSVIVTGANTGVINFYDGTTTSAHSDYATTTLFVIPASLVAGTYTVDARFTRGLIFELVSGLMPTTTITYR